MLGNEKYTGVYLFSSTEAESRTNRRSKPDAIRVEGNHPAIIVKGDFEKVQKIMKSRQHCGPKANYLCSGLVYCARGGAKMHVYPGKNKGHVYYYYRCSNRCGAPGVKLEDVDKVVTAYIQTILSPDTQKKIAAVLQTYKGHDRDRVSEFKKAVAKKIREKETEYENLVSNMTAAKLPEAVIRDLAQRMDKLGAEIAELRDAKPPIDYTVDLVQDWLRSISRSPDARAVRLFIAGIEAQRKENKTDFNISSTLKPVLEKLVAGKGLEPTTSGL